MIIQPLKRISLSALAGLFLLSACGSSGGSGTSGSSSNSAVKYPACNSNPFSDSAGFNVFVLGDMNAPSSEVEGRLAVGGNAYIANYSVGGVLTPDATRNDLIVAGNLQFPNGAVLNGKTVYGGTLNTTVAASSFGGFVQEASPIPFTVAATHLQAMSTALATLTSNSPVTYNVTGARHDSIFVGTDPLINVFGMTTEQLQNTQYLNLTIPSGSTALINVMGTDAQMNSFAMNFNGTDSSHVIFNFPNATSLYLTAIAFQGSILAPLAASTFQNGQFTGQFISGSIAYSQGQFNQALFSGCLPYSGN